MEFLRFAVTSAWSVCMNRNMQMCATLQLPKTPHYLPLFAAGLPARFYTFSPSSFQLVLSFLPSESGKGGRTPQRSAPLFARHFRRSSPCFFSTLTRAHWQRGSGPLCSVTGELRGASKYVGRSTNLIKDYDLAQERGNEQNRTDSRRMRSSPIRQ